MLTTIHRSTPLIQFTWFKYMVLGACWIDALTLTYSCTRVLLLHQPSMASKILVILVFNFLRNDVNEASFFLSKELLPSHFWFRWLPPSRASYFRNLPEISAENQTKFSLVYRTRHSCVYTYTHKGSCTAVLIKVLQL